MQLMLCIEGTIRTNTQAGKVYEVVGVFTCPHCGKVSDILEFAPPVQKFDTINCWGCKKTVNRRARYSHRKRFIPLIPDQDCVVENEKEHALA